MSITPRIGNSKAVSRHKRVVLNRAKKLSGFEILERSAKIVLASLAVLYCAGILVTNAALTSLGITDFSSLRVKYISTGALPFFLALVSSIIVDI